MVKPDEYAHNVLSLQKQRYQFWYTCDLGQFTWDFSIFAKAFCYHLECNPRSLDDLKRNLTKDIELMSFGHLQKLKIYGNLEDPLEKTELTQTQTFKKVLYDRDCLEAIRRAQPLADCLYNLANYETFTHESVDDLEEEEEKEEEEDACDSYEQYESVRDKAVEIIEEFYSCGAYFEGLEHQIELLSCYDLDEVMDVLTAHKDASSSGAAYPPRPTEWTPKESATAEDLIDNRKTKLNLPTEVISVISRAAMRLKKDKSESFPSEVYVKMLQELGFYFTAKKYEDTFAICKEKAVKVHVDKLEKYYFVSEGVLGASPDDAADVEKQIRDRCAELCLNMDDLEVIRDQMRVCVTQGSFWVVVVSPVKLKASGLKSILEDFVDHRRGTSLGWACAEAPCQVPDFAAAGFQNVVNLVEGLRAEIQVPNLVLLRGSFFKDLARQLIQRNGEEAAEWQLRAVNNYRDLEGDDWLNPHCSADLHFVQSLHWPTLPWKAPELLERLKTFAGLRPQSQVLHAVAFLIHAIQKDPEWQSMSLDTMMQVLSDTAAEPSEVLRKVVKACCGVAAQTRAEIDRAGRSALHRAAFNGEMDEVERLLIAGLDIEAKDDSRTPLNIAAEMGHWKVVQRLIDARADLEAQDDGCPTPLNIAAEEGHSEVAQRLIEARADLEAKGPLGRTPLHWAAREGHCEMAQRLIDARADLEAKDNHGPGA
ncbi:unnamed protein product [Durusdinium trenchii]|uniref:Uncharacterized protein n=1 Tax=Durusdinium trenchii TaxID=1381693 RepID=A0ABP0LNN6_9DINO